MLPALSHAWQSWKSARAVAALAVIASAVGIGSATAIYTVVNGVMLRPLPYADGQRFVALYGAGFSVRGWIKDTAQYDDLTFVVMKVS
jgi:hypothetical protein